VKQILSFALAEPQAGEQFFTQLQQYMGTPTSHGMWPGIVLPFSQLRRKASMLTFGNQWAGYGLLACMVLTWWLAAIRWWHWRRSSYGQDVLILVAAALAPAVWVLLMPRHTYIHAGFMVRILVVPIALAPVALFWPRIPRMSSGGAPRLERSNV
jgi:hypothetical protein